MGKTTQKIILVGILMLATSCGVKQVSCPISNDQLYLLSELPMCPEGIPPDRNNPCMLDCFEYVECDKRLACTNINYLTMQEHRDRLIDLVEGIGDIDGE